MRSQREKLTLFLIVSIGLLAVGACDLITTFILTPTLDFEQNPLVSIWGLGWPALITVKAILTALAVYGSYYYLFQVDISEFVTELLPIGAFYSQFFYLEQNMLHKVFTHFPSNPRSNWLVFYAAAWGFASSSAVVVAHNLLAMYFHDPYMHFIRQIPIVSVKVVYFVALPVLFVTMLGVFVMEHRSFLRTYAQQRPPSA